MKEIKNRTGGKYKGSVKKICANGDLLSQKDNIRILGNLQEARSFISIDVRAKHMIEAFAQLKANRLIPASTSLTQVL